MQQVVLRHEQERHADDRVRFRIGISLGDVVHEDSDIFGDGVNLAARLEQLAEPGGLRHAPCVRAGPASAAARFRGHRPARVKNVAEPVEVGACRPPACWPRRTSNTMVSTVGVRQPRLGVSWSPSRLGLVAIADTPAPASKPVIAVLPFANLGEDAATGRLADGITEDVITDLARYRDLVIARNSTLKYKGRPADVREVGRQLGVRYVLEGSIQRAGERVRVIAQLIEAATGGHLWSERWDRPVDDVFAGTASLRSRWPPS